MDKGDAMTTPVAVERVVGVRFHPVGKIYHFDPGPYELQIGDWVIVGTPRGQQIGRVVSLGMPSAGRIEGPLRPVERPATNRDLAIRKYWERKEIEALVVARDHARQLGLSVKIVKVEISFDGKHISFLYHTEEKVDLEPLRQRLAEAYRGREVELRLIGPRDVAKIVGGMGACGLETRCCSLFLTEFSPISIKMAKEQGLSLNPEDITGMCGRLRCCLIYEYEQYVRAKQELPKKGKAVMTPHGEGVVVEVLPLKEAALVRVGDQIHEVPKDQLQPLEELKALQQKAEKPCHNGENCTCGRRNGGNGGETDLEGSPDFEPEG
ncbi:PSP1 domain-containing protein [Thermoflexus sp.]|uniref:PSP1 domain-containing protein n=2 Tax=Thermoflexus sp. TaxID=1969742 RepID=UPI0025EDF912|nr:regulatory iron-sulfur-containing complex subunit RicT [Thermoflexus sp.]MCS6964829.1 signal peptidase II [Thermoflexus sp.]